MSLARILDFLRDRCRLLAWIGFVAFALFIAADVAATLFPSVPELVDKAHAHTKTERLPGFWSAFGLVGCALLIILSKAFGHAGIMQREGYYDE